MLLQGIDNVSGLKGTNELHVPVCDVCVCVCMHVGG